MNQASLVEYLGNQSLTFSQALNGKWYIQQSISSARNIERDGTLINHRLSVKSYAIPGIGVVEYEGDNLRILTTDNLSKSEIKLLKQKVEELINQGTSLNGTETYKRIDKVTIHKPDGDLQLVHKDAFKNLSQTNDVKFTGTTAETINNQSYYFLEKSATLLIDGTSYTAGAIAEAGEIAYGALSDFIKGNYKNNIISNALSNAINNTFADLAGIIANGGTVDTTKILQTFAKRTGYAFIASSITQTTAARELTVHLNGGEVQNINNTSYIKLKSGGNIATNANDNRPIQFLQSVA